MMMPRLPFHASEMWSDGTQGTVAPAAGREKHDYIDAFAGEARTLGGTGCAFAGNHELAEVVAEDAKVICHSPGSPVPTGGAGRERTRVRL